jgi:gliding motility-associated protein GldM
MAHERLSPRQKMIGMMYLVLTAMLALNVSKEAVEAFKNIEKGLSLTIKNYSLKNNLIYEEFEKSFAQYPAKTGPYRSKALEVKQHADELLSDPADSQRAQHADELFDYLQGLKVEILKTSEPKNTLIFEGDEINIEEVKIIDDNNVPSQILIGANDDQKAFFLTTMIDDYRDWLITDILQGENPTIEAALRQSLNTDNVRNHRTKEMEKWANHNFQALPLIYVVTMLSKIQVDVRNSETEVINHLFAQIDKSSFKFNKVDAVVIPKSTYVTQGSNYEASVFVSATDSTQAPVITVGGGQILPLDEAGKGPGPVRQPGEG